MVSSLVVDEDEVWEHAYPRLTIRTISYCAKDEDDIPAAPAKRTKVGSWTWGTAIACTGAAMGFEGPGASPCSEMVN